MKNVMSGPAMTLDIDPRSQMESRALAVASRNAFPIVATHVQQQDRLGVTLGAACALVLGGVTYWSMSVHRTPEPRVESRPAPIAIDTVPPPRPLAPVWVPQPAATAALPRVSDDPALDHRTAPALILDLPSVLAVAPAAAPVPATPVAPTAPAPKVPSQPLTADESFAERIGGGSVDTASASRLADPAHTIVQGTLIAAVLETAIDSDLPGYARAVVSQDVRSFDGSQVLVPRASHLIGQYKSGIANGQKRAYVMWSRLIRPDGVSIALASPGTDFAGNTGLAGDVDTHFLARFGSAVMLSVVDLFAAVGSAAVVISGSSQGAAAVAAQRDGQIPPTISVPQGSPIRVFTARDLDFASVAVAEAKP